MDMLGTVGADIDTPTYDRSEVTGGIVHIGVGGFHRGHLATYADELCRLGHTQWGIVGAGVLAHDETMATALRAQNLLYTLIVRDTGPPQVSVVGSIIDFIHAVGDDDSVERCIADPEIAIVSLTITEGGYPIDDQTALFQPDSPNAGPESAFGRIAAGLERRRLGCREPITIMSCDNIMSNGSVAETATLGEAQRFGPELISWIRESVSFPNSMVDRITPATADSDREWLADTHGILDRWPVVTEPFRQWVIEDRFAGRRPPLEDVGVIVTDDVEPYEFMKLRLLNAAHSCLAYLSALLDIELVDHAMADGHIAAFVRQFLETEAKPVLPPVAEISIDDYIDTLLGRFANPTIGDQIARLCLDGTAKFPKFLMPTIRGQIQAGGPTRLCALALAGWCQYLLGRSDSGRSIEPAGDPGLAQAQAAAQASLAEPAEFLQLATVFDPDIAAAPSFESDFVAALVSLREHGVHATITDMLGPIEEADSDDS